MGMTIKFEEADPTKVKIVPKYSTFARALVTSEINLTIRNNLINDLIS